MNYLRNAYYALAALVLLTLWLGNAHASRGEGGPSAPAVRIAAVTPDGIVIRESQVIRQGYRCEVIAGPAKGRTVDCPADGSPPVGRQDTTGSSR